MTTAAAKKAPPTIHVTIGPAYGFHPRRAVLQLRCGWCDRRVITPADACMACMPTVRRIVAIRTLPEWVAFCEVMQDDPTCKGIAADWLDERNLPDVAAQVRALVLADCPMCKGTGRVRNKWKTTWPHNGEPCEAWDCFAGKVFKVPEVKEV